MEFKRYFPTYYRWWESARRWPLWRTAFVTVARDAWRGTDRRCVVEFGRGVRRITHWSAQHGKIAVHGSTECEVFDPALLDESLIEDLRSVQAMGIPCEIILQPPWAAAKVFDLTDQEAQEPEHWIAQHRKVVFPTGIEDDISLSHHLQQYPGGHRRLIVGLMRRSVISALSSELEKHGSLSGTIINGPLQVFLDSLRTLNPETGLLLDRGGPGSFGCWLFLDGCVAGWAEIAGKTDEVDTDPTLPPVIQGYFGEIVVQHIQNARIVEATRYQPGFSSAAHSRWRPPFQTTIDGLSAQPARQRRLVLDSVQSWSTWLFRWGVVLTAAALVLIFFGRVLQFVDAAGGSSAAEQVTDQQAHRDRLLAERELLLPRTTALENQSGGNVMAARLWHDLGVAKAKSIWLRSVKLKTGERQVRRWSVEGLSVDRDGPYTFATALSAQTCWRARVIELEAIDASRAKQIPDALKKGIYRFTVEVEL